MRRVFSLTKTVQFIKVKLAAYSRKLYCLWLECSYSKADVEFAKRAGCSLEESAALASSNSSLYLKEKKLNRRRYTKPEGIRGLRL